MYLAARQARSKLDVVFGGTAARHIQRDVALATQT